MLCSLRCTTSCYVLITRDTFISFYYIIIIFALFHFYFILFLRVISHRTKWDTFETSISQLLFRENDRSNEKQTNDSLRQPIICGSHVAFIYRFRDRLFVSRFSPAVSKSARRVWKRGTARSRATTAWPVCQCSISKRVHYPREKARSIIVLVRLDQTEKQRAPRVTACNNWTGGAFSSWPSPVVPLETTWQFGMISTRVLLFIHPRGHPPQSLYKRNAPSGPPQRQM